jgi:hypothetical protein
MDFGEVLSKAWQITWKYKVLWIFGILAGCGGQFGNNGFNYSMNDGGNGGGTGGPGDLPLPPGMRQFFFEIERWFESLSQTEIFLFIAVGIIISLVLVAFFIVLGTIGRIGLVKGALEGDRGAVSLSFGELMQGVRPYFWRVIGLGLLLMLVFLAIGVVFAVFVGVVTVATFGLGFLCLIPVFCLLAPLGWFIGLVIQQAYVALIVENLSVTNALQRAWEVTRQNIGPVILMGLILNIGILIIGGGLIALPFTAIALPALGGLAIGTEQALQGGLLIAGLCFVLYLPVMILLGGVIRTYYESAWTLTYLRLTRPRQISTEAVLEA